MCSGFGNCIQYDGILREWHRSRKVFMNQLPTVSFLFVLDGTLIDSVYQHVLAWHEALSPLPLRASLPGKLTPVNGDCFGERLSCFLVRQ